MTRLKDISSCIAFFLVIGILWHTLQEVPEQAAYYPRALLLLFGCLVALLGITSLRSAKKSEQSAKAISQKPDGEACTEDQPLGKGTFLVLGLSFVYLLLMPYLGFIISSALLLLVFMYSLGVRSIPVLILVPLIEIGLLWFVFERLLAVLLPDADWLRALIGL